jgi:hypothetical protein
MATIEILDPEGDRIRRNNKILLICTIILSLGISSYKPIQHFSRKWKALTVARKLSEFLVQMRDQAILKQIPIEVRFAGKDKVEVYEVKNCNASDSKSETKIFEKKLSEHFSNVEFVSEEFIRNIAKYEDNVLTTYCYSPLNGFSSGVQKKDESVIFLAEKSSLEAKNLEEIAEIFVEERSGEVSLQ